MTVIHNSAGPGQEPAAPITVASDKATHHCPTCRCHPGPVCTCGHLPEQHDLKDRRQAGQTVRIRTACSVHTGPNATPCGCLAYTPQEET